MSPRSSRTTGLLAVAATALLLAACTSAGADTRGPDWSPQPTFPGDGGGAPSPGVVVPPLPGPTGTPRSQPPSSSGSAAPAGDPNVVATRLDNPVGVAVLPDGSALVGERTTGRIVRVQPRAGQPVPTVRTLTGLDTSGGGGLLDLALSPSYPEDNLVFAYLSTATDDRVVDFTLDGPVTPVLTGIPHGTAGRIMFGADGDLYVGTSTAVLRVSAIGRAATGNPAAGSAVYASGTTSVDGLCTDAKGTAVYAVEARPSAATDRVEQVRAGSLTPLRAPTQANGRGLGGRAVDSGVLYVASRDGRALLASSIDTRSGVITLGPYTPYLRGRYGRLVSVVAAPDGTLWLTTSNRDGHGTPVATDDRVLHIQPPASSGVSPA